MKRDAFELELPPGPEHLATARSFAAAVARRFGASGETVEDLKLAVSEACTDAMAADRTVHVKAELIDGALAFEVDAPSDGLASDGAGDRLTPTGMELVRTLFPDAELGGSGDRRVLRFTMTLG